MTSIDITLPSSVSTYIRNLQILSDGKVVVICGTTNKYYYKQMAQEAIKHLRPHLIVNNQIKVIYPGDVA